MTIRQMRSMSGWRRFISDYGFEGFCRPENMERFRNVVLYTVGVSSALFAGVVFLNRMGEPMGHKELSKLVVFSPEKEEILGRRIFQRGLELCLGDQLNFDQLQFAADRLAPIESRIQEVCAFIEKLRLEKSREPSKESFADLMASAGMTRMGFPVKQAIVDAGRNAKSIDDFEMRLYRQLVQSWESAGYFDQSTFANRNVFSRRQTSEAVSVDIGTTVSCDLKKLSLRSVNEAVQSVQQWGFVVVKSAISASRLHLLRESLLLDEGLATDIGQRIVGMDKNISHSRALPNRLQLLIRGSALESDFQDLHDRILPIVTSISDRKSVNPSRVVLTDVRLIVVDCAADKGNWTLMNPRGGYTALIPLHDRDSKSGTQVILPGSHFLADPSLHLYQKLFFTAQRYTKVKRPIAVSELFPDGCWRAGDALIMDNRLLHRSEENKRFKSGTYLLMKYETIEEAPVGMYFSGKLTYRLAALLEKAAKWALPIE